MIREFRPLTIGGLFDAFLKVFFSKDSLRLLGIYLAVSLPLLVIGAIALGQTVVKLFTDLIPNTDIGELGLDDLGGLVPPLLTAVIVPLYALLVIVYTMMATDLYGKRFFETPYALAASFRGILKKIPGFLLYLVLSYAYFSSLSMIGSILLTALTAVSVAFSDTTLFLILAIVAVCLVIAVMQAAGILVGGTLPAFIIDRKGLFKSIGASFKLFSKNYFKVFLTGFLFTAIIFFGSVILVGAFVIGIVLFLSTRHIEESQIATVVVVLFLAAYAIIYIIMSIAGNAFNAVLYCNQKIKHEGLGGELLARRFIEENQAKGETPSVT